MKARVAWLVVLVLTLAACDPTSSTSPTPTPPAVSCPTGPVIDEFIALSTGTPSVAASGDLCIVDFILFLPGVASGDAVVNLDGSPILTVDLATYETTGEEGAGSGERVVTPAAPIPVASGATLSLDLGACSGCGSFTVTVEADSL
jgi:hypothetical protein